MFAFLRKEKTTAVAAPQVLSAYTMYGFASHLMRDGDDWITLCGREVVKVGHPETVDEVINSIPRQHSNFFYCTGCVEIYTGVHPAETLSHRKN